MMHMNLNQIIKDPDMLLYVKYQDSILSENELTYKPELIEYLIKNISKFKIIICIFKDELLSLFDAYEIIDKNLYYIKIELTESG